MTFNLGPLSYFMFPVNCNVFSFKGAAAHAVIYSKKYMKLFVNNANNKTINDFFWEKYFPNNYCLRNPICFQIFTYTSNTKESQNKCIINKIVLDILIYFSEKNPVLMINVCYIFAKTWWIISILYIIYILKKRKNKF